MPVCRNGNGVLANMIPTCMNICSDPHLINCSIAAGKKIIAPQQLSPSGDAVRRCFDNPPLQISTRNGRIVKFPYIQYALHKVKLEITVTHRCISVKKRADPVANFLPGRIKNKSVPPHTFKRQARLSSLTHSEHLSLFLCNPALWFGENRCKPKSGFKTHFRQFPCQIFHTMRKKRIGFPFSVTVLPAVINDNPTDSACKHGVMCNKIRIGENLFFSDGPPVIIPTVPTTSGRSGKIRAPSTTDSGILLHQCKRIVSAKNQNIPGIDIRESLMQKRETQRKTRQQLTAFPVKFRQRSSTQRCRTIKMITSPTQHRSIIADKTALQSGKNNGFSMASRPS